MLEFNVSRKETVDMELNDVYMVSVDDYEKLKNLPLLDGRKIIGNMQERDPTVPEWAKKQSKPTYTAKEVDAIGTSDVMSLEEIDDMFKQIFG